MVAIGQPYRPAGTLDVRSILITLILGVTAAVLGAAVIWLWEWSPIPTLVVLTHCIQGLFVGGVMAFAVDRLRLRNPRFIATVGFACGLLSIALVHYGHYLSMVTSSTAALRSQVVEDRTIPEPQRKALLEQLDADPAGVFDQTLVRMTGHSGFIGSLFLRSELGFTIKGRHESGTFVWVLWGFEAFIAALVAAIAPASVASRAYCEDCGYWCDKATDLITLPAAIADPMVLALREDNPALVAELRSNPPPYDESGFLDIVLHNCPGCEVCFANVTRRFMKKKETKFIPLLKACRISPEAAAALRGTEPAVDAEAAEADEIGREQPEELAGEARGDAVDPGTLA
jgi:hypothetical protein